MATRRLFVLALLLVAGAARADVRTDRLAHLARLWGTVKLADPWVWSHDVDLDRLLVEAIPRVEAAKTTAEYRDAVAAMLGGLGDSVSRVPGPDEKPGPPPSPDGDLMREERGVLVVTLARWKRTTPAAETTAAVKAAMDKARAVVFDVRGADDLASSSLWNELGNVWSKRTLAGVSNRLVFHSGYRPQDGFGSGGYDTFAITSAAPQFPGRPGARPRRTVFLVSNTSPAPPIAFALAASGDAFLVSDGLFIPESEIPVDLGEGVVAMVRGSDSDPPVDADVEVPAGKDPLAAALALAQGTSRKKPSSSRALPPIVWRPDATYADTPYPSRELRLLALFRYWNVIHSFYPYLALIGDWDAVLPEMIPRFEGAADALGYAQAVAELMTRVPDGHSVLIKKGALGDALGDAMPPVSIRLVEGWPTIIKVREAGLPVSVGDVVLTVDGEPAAQRAERMGKYLSASWKGVHDQRAAGMLLLGPADKPARVTVCGPSGGTREVELPRRKPQPPPDPPLDEVVKIVGKNIGYVNLAYLNVRDVEGMFARLKDTRAIVFDMRGYPRSTAFVIAPRINRKHARVAAHFERPEVLGGATRRMVFDQELPGADGPIYDRPTVMLIDDRTQSQAEHTGLFFEAASGTRFVGSPTAGANGDVTTVTFPGGLAGWMTGHDVRHADGRQLQRIGLVPDVRVEPTLAGLRAGKDEVLDAALRDLETCLAVPSGPCGSP